jgi:hypothetical protein
MGIAPLDIGDLEAVRDWLAEVDKEPPPDNPFRRFIVNPHWKWHEAPETRRRLYRRFSCAGFVLECYRSIDVYLVDTEEGGLPDVHFDIVVKAYPEAGDREKLARLTGGVTPEDLGIPGDGPWPVLLPGYIFHALQRITEENPRPPAYTPSSVADACFPFEGSPDD